MDFFQSGELGVGSRQGVVTPLKTHLAEVQMIRLIRTVTNTTKSGVYRW